MELLILMGDGFIPTYRLFINPLVSSVALVFAHGLLINMLLVLYFSVLVMFILCLARASFIADEALRKPVLGGLLLGGAIVAIAYFFPSDFKILILKNHYAFEASCRNNLKRLGSALEKYSADTHGEFPEDLRQLSPRYITRIPRCIEMDSPRAAAFYAKREGLYMGDYGYSRNSGCTNYTLYCKTNIHGYDPEPGFPQYSHREGFIDGKK